MKKGYYLNSVGTRVPCVVVAENPDGTVDVAADENSHVFIVGAKLATKSEEPSAVHVADPEAEAKAKAEAEAKAKAEAEAKAKAEAEAKAKDKK